MADKRESVIVVGTRPTLPNQQVDVGEEYDQNLRCRGNYGSSSSLPGPGTACFMEPGLAASTSTPAQPPQDGEYSRRAYPCFGTPGSLTDMCPDQSVLDLPPLDVRASPIQSHSSPPDVKLKLDLENTYILDSGYGNDTNSSYGDGLSNRSSVYDSFTNPEGSSVFSRSIWEFFTPVKDLKKKWKGKPSYLDDPKSVGFVERLSFEPQQLLGGLMLIIIFASVGFTFLVSFRNMDGTPQEMNSKYKSIEFGRQKQVERLREEGRLLEEVRDEDGNLLGGKKAAIQFSYDQRVKLQGENDDGRVAKVNEDTVSDHDKMGSSENIKTGEDERMVNEGFDGFEKDTNEFVYEVEPNDDIKLKILQNEVEELDNEKRRKLALMKKVKRFNKQMVGDSPKPRKLYVVDGLSMEVKVPPVEELKSRTKTKRKSPANPLAKSVPRRPKMSKVRRVAQST